MPVEVEENQRRSVDTLQLSVHDPEKSNPPPSFYSQNSLRAPSSQRVSSVPEFFDPNFDVDAAWLEDDSPYPEVRAAVANFDDPSIPVTTLRAWLFGLLWAMVLPGINQFFYFRFPTISVTSIVPLLITFPLGRAWARIMPEWRVFGISLNPGPFTIKEHVLVTVMAGVGSGAAYATEIIAVQRVWYHQDFNFAYQWMLVMSTQMIGYSVGGLARRLLVEPASMIWPSTLVLCALYNTLHSATYSGIPLREGTMSRERFFTFAFVLATVWYIFPGYLFQALSTFTWACWLAPDNVKVNLLFGYRSGMGFSILSFDWNQIALIGSPLATPWWAEANVFAGFIFFYWLLAPVLYFTNIWYSQYMPISSSGSYDNQGNTYNITRIVFANTTFNREAYEEYSPLFLSTTFALSYGLSFASITATIVHALLYFWKPIRIHLSRSLGEQPDIHAQLMMRYRKVPEWWYACILVVTFAFACVCIEAYPTQMKVWALLIALLIALVYIIPIGMIQAVTNRQVGLNVITELIVGYMLPGRPVAMMMFKTWGYITMSQAMAFTADFKLGHYMKIPPRAMFWSQITATVIAGTSQLGVMSWMFSHIPDLCLAQQEDMSGFTCANTEVFATASIIWGVIGPAAVFTHGMYYPLLFFFIVGIIAPLTVWLLTKKFPDSWLNYVNFPLMFTGLGLIPPATAVNYIPWAILGFIFQHILRRRYFSAWAKYNYVLSAALDAGTAIGTILVYFCLQYPRNGNIGQNNVSLWWGNTVFKNTSDWSGIPLRKPPPGGTFGPDTW